MPTYEYQCTNCGEHTEAFQRMSDAPLTKCPKCNHETLKRLVTGGAGVIYKGEGWYVTDYSKKSSGGKDSDTPSKPDTGKKETPPASAKSGESTTGGSNSVTKTDQ